ncbi:MAG: hypothetical protein J6T46_12930, partial [Victivallales bacterium]|nr:hypothetical protein [Victivallales bacterium]
MTQVQSRFIPKFLAWLREISGANEPSAPVQGKLTEQPKQPVKSEKKPVEATKATEAVEATKATEAVEAVKATEAVEAVKVTEAVKATEAIEAESVDDDKLAGQAENREVRSIGKWEVPPAVREKEGDILFQDFPLDPRILRALLE